MLEIYSWPEDSAELKRREGRGHKKAEGGGWVEGVGGGGVKMGKKKKKQL